MTSEKRLMLHFAAKIGVCCSACRSFNWLLPNTSTCMPTLMNTSMCEWVYVIDCLLIKLLLKLWWDISLLCSIHSHHIASKQWKTFPITLCLNLGYLQVRLIWEVWRVVVNWVCVRLILRCMIIWQICMVFL
jgi:hypothetical protein